MKEKEYKDCIFLITIPEGGRLADARVEGFDGFAQTGEYKPQQQIRFYTKVIGLEDLGAPLRNWGYSLDDFNKFRRMITNKLRDYLRKIL